MKSPVALWMMVFATVFAFSAALACSCGDDDDDNDDNVFPDDDTGVPDDDSDDDTGDDDADDDATDDDDDTAVVPPHDTQPPPWPEWVLRQWVWLDESTQQSAQDFVDGFLENDIPVGAVIIDSPWETGYNTFEWDTGLYPDAQGMIDYFHSLDVRVFLWITPNVNVDSPNFQEGYDNGYYVNNGNTLEWWKGEGAFIDYWNPDALDWWHGLMDNVLDMGIDGWKTDGSEFSLYLWLYVKTADGPKLPAEYQARYYEDFFHYTRERLGPDRVITARPVDSYGIPWGPNFAPIDVNFAGWVGDQDPDFGGLRAALLNMFMSGNRGYVNFGSDIGGYRGDDPRQKELMIRWMQLGAMSPIMENGGSGEHRPWMYDAETLTICRAFVKLHHMLIPYLYSQGAVSYANGVSLFRPEYRRHWEYMLGDALLVAPMMDDGQTREVRFPEGTWIHYFTGAEYDGGTTQDINVPLDEFPIFVKKGSIIPMHLFEGGVLPGGEPEGMQSLTIDAYPDGGEHEFELYSEKGPGGLLTLGTANGGVEMTASASTRAFAFRIFGEEKPSSVTSESDGELSELADVDALAAADTGWTYADGVLWIKPGTALRGLRVTAIP